MFAYICTVKAINEMAKITKHTATFVSDYGKLWQIDYTAKDGEVDNIDTITISGQNYPATVYKVKTVSRENRIINAVRSKVDLLEVIADDIAERDTHHYVDND